MKILLAPLVIGSMFLLSSCNSSSESNSFDFLKEMHDKYMKARVDGKAEHKSDKELDNEFYSAYEGDKIKLTDFVILAIERVLPQNQAVYNDASGKASPLYRLHLAAMKDIGGKKVGIGGIRMRGGLTYDFFGNPDGQAIDFYDCNAFSPIDMVDEGLMNASIIVDVFDESLIKGIEAVQTMFITDDRVYSPEILDSIRNTKNLEPTTDNSIKMGLWFLLNKIDVTLEFPKYSEDEGFMPYRYKRWGFNLVSIDRLEKLNSPGRDLFEKYYKMDYSKVLENFRGLKVSAEDEQMVEFLNQSIDKQSGYVISRNAEYETSANLVELLYRLKTEFRSALFDGPVNAERLGLNQITPMNYYLISYEGEDTLAATVSGGYLIDGYFSQNAFGFGSIGVLSDTGYIVTNETMYWSINNEYKLNSRSGTASLELRLTPASLKQYWIMRGVLTKCFKTSVIPSVCNFRNGKFSTVAFKISDGVLMFTFNDNETISNVSSTSSSITCNFNPTLNEIRLNTIDPFGQSSEIKISASDGSLIQNSSQDTLKI